AEDGIRDDLVTGVQTCALPIWDRDLQRRAVRDGASAREGAAARSDQELCPAAGPAAEADGGVRAQHRRAGGDARDLPGGLHRRQIGRASCRESVENTVVSATEK